MPLIRAILNNGFFFIVLIVATALYLAYSDNIKRDHGLLADDSASPELNEPQSQPTVEVASIALKSDRLVEAPAIADKVESIDVVAKPSQPMESVENSSETAVVAAIENTAEIMATEATVVQPELDPPSTPATEAPQPEIKTTEDKAPESVVACISNNTNTDEVTNAPLTTQDAEQTTQASEQTPIPEFNSAEQALQAARQAVENKDLLTAEKIYFDIVDKRPSANVLGELAYVLHTIGKTDWAQKSWIDSAKLLVAEGRFQEAMTLANRLAPIAPKAAREIGMNVNKIMYARNLQKAQRQQAQMYQAMQNRQQKPSQSQQPTVQHPPINMPLAMQQDPRFIDWQKEQQARHQAYLQQMRQQQSHMQQPMHPPMQQSPMNMPQGMQQDPRFIEWQKQQQARHQAYLQQMRQQQMKQQQSQIQQPMQPPMQQAPMNMPQGMQQDPRFIEWQKQQKARYEAYLQQMRQQQMNQQQSQMPQTTEKQ